MPAMEKKLFERELRGLIDSRFERSDMPDVPFKKLLRGELEQVELRDFYQRERAWQLNMVFAQVTLPLLLERCPDDWGRARLWELIYPEYGVGRLSAAHATMARNFYLAIGIPESELGRHIAPGPKNEEAIESLRKQSFVELLAGGFLCPETLGPKVFGTYANSLMDRFGLSKQDVQFWRLHGVEDKRDSEILFELVARYATTEEDQQKARRSIVAFYDRERIKALCAIRPIGHFYLSAMSS